MDIYINCIANLGLACELIYAVNPPDWAYDINEAVAVTNALIKDEKYDKDGLKLGLFSLVTYQLINPSKVVIGWITQLEPRKEENIEHLKSGKIMLNAQLLIIQQNIDAIEAIVSFKHNIFDHVLQLHADYHKHFNEYCKMVQEHLNKLVEYTEAAIMGYYITNLDGVSNAFEELMTESYYIAYFMIAFDPTNYLIQLYAPSTDSPDPYAVRMRGAILQLKHCATAIVGELSVTYEPSFGNSLLSFSTFVYIMGTKSHLNDTSTTLPDHIDVDAFLFGQYCRDYYTLIAILPIDHVKIAEKLWLNLIALMYMEPEIFGHDQDDRMRHAILTKVGVKEHKIQFIHARIYVAIGALAPFQTDTETSEYVTKMIKYDRRLVKEITSNIYKPGPGPGGYTKLSSDAFIAILTSIKRSRVIPSGKHICDKFSWCYACKTIHRAQQELVRARDSKFAIAMSDDKRVLAQIQYEKLASPLFNVPAVTNKSRVLKVKNRRDLDIF